ncbi:MAG: DsbA family oxidoreductase [Bacteroidia bacterium]|nr:DsbA family oxidoreductase [Bacteroidia bacterium]
MLYPKIKIEVWTDIMCPYCYIGKIHYEKALKQFAHANEVELIIKAFQLNPDLPDKGNGYPVVDYLLETAGIPEDSVNRMFTSIEAMADNVGVKFNLRNAIAANTMDAHRLIKLAAKKNLDSDILMLISKAYFEDARDYSNIELLVELGQKVGLDETEMRQMFAGDDFRKEVMQDIEEAHKLGIDTVPTFLFERQQAIIGSESVAVFLDTLNKTYENRNRKSDNNTQEKPEVRKGKSCNPDGTCEL